MKKQKQDQNIKNLKTMFTIMKKQEYTIKRFLGLISSLSLGSFVVISTPLSLINKGGRQNLNLYFMIPTSCSRIRVAVLYNLNKPEVGVRWGADLTLQKFRLICLYLWIFDLIFSAHTTMGVSCWLKCHHPVWLLRFLGLRTARG